MLPFLPSARFGFSQERVFSGESADAVGDEQGAPGNIDNYRFFYPGTDLARPAKKRNRPNNKLAALEITALPARFIFSPAGGAPGAKVTLNGNYLHGTTGVQFNGVPAGFRIISSYQVVAVVPANAAPGPITVSTIGGIAASFTLDSDSQITAIVPANVTTGLIKVTTRAGTATSATNFTRT